jgi:hypothetical protein
MQMGLLKPGSQLIDDSSLICLPGRERQSRRPFQESYLESDAKVFDFDKRTNRCIQFTSHEDESISWRCFADDGPLQMCPQAVEELLSFSSLIFR